MMLSNVAGVLLSMVICANLSADGSACIGLVTSCTTLTTMNDADPQLYGEGGIIYITVRY